MAVGGSLAGGGKGTRLVQVRAMGPGAPFYGRS